MTEPLDDLPTRMPAPGEASVAAVPQVDLDLDHAPTLRGLRSGLEVFGRRYTLKRQLGRGGMGVVWLAHDRKLDLDVALKFLPEGLQDDKVAVDELRRETRRCLQLTHALIVRTFDLAEEHGMVAIAMEYVEGSTLGELRLGQPARVLDTAALHPLLRQVSEALTYAHEHAKLVHRDIKPSNIMVHATTGKVKLADFGMSSSLSDTLSRLTRAGSGSSGGTLAYMSPQQLMGHAPTVADDIYALGATLYEMLTGKPPFFRGSLERQIESQTPPSMMERRAELGVEGAASIPRAWEKVVAACLDKDKTRRPQSARALIEMLDTEGAAEAKAAAQTRLRHATATSPRRLRPWQKAGAAAALPLLGFGIWLTTKPGPDARQQSVSVAPAAIVPSLAPAPSAAAAPALFPAPPDPEAEARKAHTAKVTALKQEINQSPSGSAMRRANLEELLTLQPDDLWAKAQVEEIKAVEVQRMAQQKREADQNKVDDLVAQANSCYLATDWDAALEKLDAALLILPRDKAATSLKTTVETARSNALKAIATAPPMPPVSRPLIPAPETAPAPEPAQAPDLPASGYFPLDAVFDGTAYDSYNSYSRGQVLKQAQQKLKSAGHYSGTPDGSMGPGTQKAILAWQKQNSLPASGKLDSATQSGLDILGIQETPSPSVSTRPKSSPSNTGSPRPFSGGQDAENNVRRKLGL
ncbi:MAG: protein kinase domain-containing protein [Prosthecobacter sp.]